MSVLNWNDEKTNDEVIEEHRVSVGYNNVNFFISQFPATLCWNDANADDETNKEHRASVNDNGVNLVTTMNYTSCLRKGRRPKLILF